MRYVHGDDKSIENAESLFERFVGKRLAVETYAEDVVIRNSIASLAHSPVQRIVSITAHLAANASIVPWSMDVDISPADVYVEGSALSLPTSLFGTPYTSASVVYEAGLDEIPDDIIAVVREIASLGLDEWAGVNALSDESQKTIDRYRKAVR